MSGPIVRTGTTPEFWKNWDNVFGEKSKTKASKKTDGAVAKAGKKVAEKTTAKPGKKAAKKSK